MSGEVRGAQGCGEATPTLTGKRKKTPVPAQTSSADPQPSPSFSRFLPQEP